MLTSLLAVLCIGGMILSLGLHLFGLPANWIIFILVAVWSFASPGGPVWSVLLLLGGLAALGEGLEFILLVRGGKKYGGSTPGAVGGMIGAFIGAIAGAPFFLGVGAFIGALAGAFAGSLAIERIRGMHGREALRAAWGSMLGRFGGTMLKACVGLSMIAIAAPNIWPG